MKINYYNIFMKEIIVLCFRRFCSKSSKDITPFYKKINLQKN